MRNTAIILTLCIAGLWGCATWSGVGGPYTENSKNFRVDLPSGWHKYNRVRDALMITKDGLPLQQIKIVQISVDKELAHTKKKLSEKMLPHEAAELVVDNFRSNPNLLNQEILENSPAQVSNQNGFKIVCTYETKGGLPKKAAIYGLLDGNWYYEMIYEAPQRWYFHHDLPAFENVAQSFQLIKSAGQ
ncbi:MAG: hypothetical protein JSW39_19715 [Desulfobacterales bacterium]|nr:MAG: hypothetical protein JSW39_19715 [Desulfobacterales bacterium]